MIDLSIYDLKKIKKSDFIYLFHAEQMNRIQWKNNQPLWRRILLMEKPIPIKYTLKCLEEKK